jgi:hypothetical protein
MNPEAATLHAELEERLRFETLLADLSSKFINLPAGEVDREIEDAQGGHNRIVTLRIAFQR